MDPISVETLCTWLAERRQVSLVDVSPKAVWAEGAIPGSLHINAYEALKAHDPTALADLSLPRDRPVVTICAAGKTASQVAAEQLTAQGLQVFFLEGGLYAWKAAGYPTQVYPDDDAHQSGKETIDGKQTHLSSGD
jgi:rhodanese-related sulfurtransferase